MSSKRHSNIQSMIERRLSQTTLKTVLKKKLKGARHKEIRNDRFDPNKGSDSSIRIILAFYVF